MPLLNTIVDLSHHNTVTSFSDARCRFPFNLSLLIFQLAQLTLSMCHLSAKLAVEERINCKFELING